MLDGPEVVCWPARPRALLVTGGDVCLGQLEARAALGRGELEFHHALVAFGPTTLAPGHGDHLVGALKTHNKTKN